MRRLAKKLKLALAGLVGGFAFACSGPANPGEAPPLAPRPGPVQPAPTTPGDSPGTPVPSSPNPDQPVPGAPDPLDPATPGPTFPTPDAGAPNAPEARRSRASEPVAAVTHVAPAEVRTSRLQTPDGGVTIDAGAPAGDAGAPSPAPDDDDAPRDAGVPLPPLPDGGLPPDAAKLVPPK